jgi:ribose 1,5-bisphosphokinase
MFIVFSMKLGKIYYMIGASGSGKGTLMRYAQEKLKGRYPIIFPSRYVTKPTHQAEGDISLTYDEMKKRIEDEEFLIACGYNGNFYALGSVFEEAIKYGVSVVTDGSRELLLEMEYEGLYPDIYPYIRSIFIEVESDIAEERIYERGREGLEEIQKRVRRINRFNQAKTVSVKVINNSGDIEEAGEELVEFLKEDLML